MRSRMCVNARERVHVTRAQSKTYFVCKLDAALNDGSMYIVHYASSICKLTKTRKLIEKVQHLQISSVRSAFGYERIEQTAAATRQTTTLLFCSYLVCRVVDKL